MRLRLTVSERSHLRDLLETPLGGLVTKGQKSRIEPDMVVRTIETALMGDRFLKANKAEFLYLLAKVSGIHDHGVAGLIREEKVKSHADTELVSDEAMQEFLANSKQALKVSREVSVAKIADFSFTRMAVSEIEQSKNSCETCA